MDRAVTVRTQRDKVGGRIIEARAIGSRQWLEVMHFNDPTGSAIRLLRIEPADHADRAVESKAQKPVSRITLTSLYQLKRDAPFEVHFVIGR